MNRFVILLVIARCGAVSMFLFAGCSFVLDTDVLQQDTEQPTVQDTDTVVPNECEVDGDCADAFPCTGDECGANGQCVHIANNGLCERFEYCSVTEGCTPTGEVCANALDCEDDIPCTIDLCELGRCRNLVDHTQCSNSVPFCRQEARCIPEAGGCVEGAVILCDAPQSGICVTAACNEQTGNCEEQLSPGADNDTDYSLDAQCGGEDCDDADATIFRGAPERCNTKDNDCDGLPDMSLTIDDTITAAEGPTLMNPKVAHNDTTFGVLYEDDTLRAALVDASGNVFSFDLSTLTSGTLRMGDIVADPTTQDTFFVVWNTLSDGNAGTLQVAKLTLNGTADAVEGTLVATLDHQITAEVMDCVIAYDNLRTDNGWVVAWSETDATNGYIQLQTHDMEASLEVNASAGTVASVSLAVVDATDYHISFVANYTASSGGNNEVYEAKVQNALDFTVATSATLVSTADADGVDDVDPSIQPVAVAGADGAWYSAYVDFLGYGDLRSINLWDGMVQQQQDVLSTPIAHDILGLNLVFDGHKLALMYIIKTATQTSMILQQRTPTGTGSFTQVSEQTFMMQNASSEIDYSALNASASSERQLALAWIVKDGTSAQLQLSLLKTCIQ